MPAGYSGTPLVKKLGIKPGTKLFVCDEPNDYWKWITPLPADVDVLEKGKKEHLDFIHLFVLERKVFEKEFLKCKGYLKKDGTLWISWPKKASKVKTDLDETIIRVFGLNHGLVDVKVCAVDEIWSGLKFMYRLKDR